MAVSGTRLRLDNNNLAVSSELKIGDLINKLVMVFRGEYGIG
jgi:hypothetical protein